MRDVMGACARKAERERNMLLLDEMVVWKVFQEPQQLKHGVK